VQLERALGAYIQQTVAHAAVARRSRLWLAGAGAAAAVLVLAAAWLISTRSGSAPPGAAGDTAVQSPATTEGRLALAATSLAVNNYRAAAAYAAEVLAVDPANRDAARIRDEARAGLARFDAALADARRRLADGDLTGAAQALDLARAIDPTAPGLVELTTRLADAVRAKQATGRSSASDRPSAAGTAPDRAAGAPRAGPPATAVPPAPVVPSPAAGVTPAPATPGPPPQTLSPSPGAPPAPAATVPTPPPATPPPAPAPTPAPAAAVPAATAPAPAAPPARQPASPAAPADDDEAAIRRVVASYARAIETKDLSLFRTIKPNLSREEERRLQDGFRAVTAQSVNATVVSVDRRRDEATVVLRRRDTIEAGGRQQTVDSQQTLRLARGAAGWVIVEIR
jgi:hypothetical protein